MPREVRLYRRRTSNTQWVRLDPSTPEGRRALALFTHPKERVMTTTAGRTTVPGSVIQDPETGATWATDEHGDIVKVAGGGLLSKVSGFFRGLWGGIKSAWASVKKALHLDSAVEKVKQGWGWVKAKARAGARFLHLDGLIGLAMLSVSTHTGRSAIKTVFSPLLWVGRQLGRAYVWVEEAINDGKRGTIRSWIAQRMIDGRVFFFGDADKKHGILPGFILWMAKTFGNNLLVESRTMRTARSIGTFLFGRRMAAGLIARFVTVATASWLLPLSTLVIIGLSIAPFAPEIKSVAKGAKEKFVATRKEADQIVQETAKDVHATTAEAAALATGRPVPANRQQQRAAERVKPDAAKTAHQPRRH
jgi:hypothetical protein